jgi:hypothetical protein
MTMDLWMWAVGCIDGTGTHRKINDKDKIHEGLRRF